MTESPLQALRGAGADAFDPVRFHFLEALAQRAQAAPPAVSARLAQRLEAALAAYEADRAREPTAPPPASPARGAQPTPLGSLLAQLNRPPKADAAPTPPGELRSAAGFRDAWSPIAADQQLARASQRAPENAGPLNSHALVLRSLERMRQLSPAYLRRFLSQVDTLLWLEQAQPRRAAAARPASAAAHKRAPRA